MSAISLRAQQPDHPLDATVIIEVLSDSTRQYDRNDKFENYKQLPSLRHYLLIETNGVSIEHRFQLENGDWQSQTFTTLKKVLYLSSVTCSLNICTMYEGIECA